MAYEKGDLLVLYMDRDQDTSGLVEGLYDPRKVGGLVDPPSGESSFVA